MTNYKKINVYNKTIKKPLQKIWLRTPQLKIFKQSSINAKHKLSIPLKAAINPYDKDCKKLIAFIRNFETLADSYIKENVNADLTGRSSLTKFDKLPTIMTFAMPYKTVSENSLEFNFHIYNSHNKRVTLSTVESNCYTALFVELADIWINGTEYGYNWNVLQMKLYPEFDFTQCLFLDEATEETPAPPPNECYHCLYCPNLHVRTHERFTPPPPPPMTPTVTKAATTSNNSNNNKNNISSGVFVPTVKDLLSVKLRPVVKPKK
jgi:hypothetical protein